MTVNMKAWKKIAIGVGILVLLLGIVSFTVYQSRKNVVTVQTGKAQHQDLATVVSASGEIKPKTYVNVGANAFGKITHDIGELAAAAEEHGDHRDDDQPVPDTEASHVRPRTS